MRFQRANFLVSDLDRALVLYRDTLGMTVDLIKESEEDSYSYDVFEIDRSIKLNFVLLSYENQPRVMALTELGKNSLAKASHPRRSAIVIEVADVDALLNKALKNNFKIYREEKLVTHDGREGREIGILDDDGNLIVIYKIEKDNK